MIKNLATVTVAAGTMLVVGTISFLAISNRPVPEALERIGSSLVAGALGMAQPVGSFVTGAAAAIGGAAMMNKANKENEDDASN